MIWILTKLSFSCHKEKEYDFYNVYNLQQLFAIFKKSYPDLMKASAQRKYKFKLRTLLVLSQGSPRQHCWVFNGSSLSPAVHIQANLEDDLVKEALKTVRISRRCSLSWQVGVQENRRPPAAAQRPVFFSATNKISPVFMR